VGNEGDSGSGGGNSNNDDEGGSNGDGNKKPIEVCDSSRKYHYIMFDKDNKRINDYSTIAKQREVMKIYLCETTSTSGDAGTCQPVSNCSILEKKYFIFEDGIALYCTVKEGCKEESIDETGKFYLINDVKYGVDEIEKNKKYYLFDKMNCGNLVNENDIVFTNGGYLHFCKKNTDVECHQIRKPESEKGYYIDGFNLYTCDTSLIGSPVPNGNNYAIKCKKTYRGPIYVEGQCKINQVVYKNDGYYICTADGKPKKLEKKDEVYISKKNNSYDTIYYNEYDVNENERLDIIKANNMMVLKSTDLGKYKKSILLNKLYSIIYIIEK